MNINKQKFLTFCSFHVIGWVFYLWNLSIITLLWLLLLQVLQSKYKTCVWILGGWVASICVGQGHLAAQHHLKPQTLEASFFSLPCFRLFWLLFVFAMEWTEIKKNQELLFVPTKTILKGLKLLSASLFPHIPLPASPSHLPQTLSVDKWTHALVAGNRTSNIIEPSAKQI